MNNISNIIKQLKVRQNAIKTAIKVLENFQQSFTTNTPQKKQSTTKIKTSHAIKNYPEILKYVRNMVEEKEIGVEFFCSDISIRIRFDFSDSPRNANLGMRALNVLIKEGIVEKVHTEGKVKYRRIAPKETTLQAIENQII